MKTLLKLSLALTLCLSAGLSFAKESLTIATEGAWAPFNFVDASGKAQGFDVDIAMALCEQMQVECKIVTQDWEGLIPGLRFRKFDAVVASMSITEERAKRVEFTHPYYSNGLRFMGLKSSPIKTDKDSLKDKVLGAQRSTLAGQYAQKELGKIANVKLYDNQEQVYLELMAGRLDIVLSDELPTYSWLKNPEHSDFEFKGEGFMKEDKIGIAVRKGNHALVDKLNASLQAIIDNGTYQKINAKYFPFSIL